jgi:hypothetical protein
MLNAYSGINLLLAENENYTEGKFLDLYGNQTDSVFIIKRAWGLFTLTVSNAVFKNHQHAKVAFTGKQKPLQDLPALYLADKNEPLVVTGATVIAGNCSLPQAGLKRGYIEGKHFSGDKMVDGNIINSNSMLPAVNIAFIKGIKNQLRELQAQSDSSVYLKDGFFTDSIIQSFTNNTLLLKAEHTLKIESGSFLRGNIILTSSQPVTISADAIIEDIIIYAPGIVIEDAFSGNVQLFATDSISIGKKCELHYPSSLVLLRNNENFTNSNIIRVGESSIISGAIYTEKNILAQQRISVSLQTSKDAVINGWVYVNGMMQHSGIIYGHLYCEGFFLKTTSSLYENHLLDAVIDSRKLSDYYVYPDIINESKTNKVVKWLY